MTKRATVSWSATVLVMASWFAGGCGSDDSGPADAGDDGSAEAADDGAAESTDSTGEDAGGSEDGSDADSGPPPSDPQRWIATGSLAVGRTNHTATLVPSGQVVVIGGERYDYTPIDSIEAWEPASGEWTTLTPLPAGRSNHTATLLPSGEILIVGGGESNDVGGPAGRGVTDSVLRLDPATGALTPAAPLAIARSHHTATLLPSGRVLVVGGAAGTHAVSASFGDALADAAVYDPEADAWMPAPALAAARFLHSATLLASGEVVVAGGSDEAEAELPEVESLSPSASAWTRLGDLGTARVFHASSLLPGNRVFVAAGKLANIRFLDSTEILSPSSGSWAPGAPVSSSRTAPTLTALASGRLLLAGGLHNAGSSFTYQRDAAIYDPEADTWTAIGDLARARALHTATLLPSGAVLVVGGVGTSNVHTSCELAVP